MKLTNYNYRKYLNCEKYYKLEKLYTHKMSANISCNNEEKEIILKKMFSDSGETNVKINDETNKINYLFLKSSFQNRMKLINSMARFCVSVHKREGTHELECEIDCLIEDENNIYIIQNLPVTKESFFKEVGIKNCDVEVICDLHFVDIERVNNRGEKKESKYLIDYDFVKYVYEASVLFNPYKQTHYLCSVLERNKEGYFSLIDVSNLLSSEEQTKYKVYSIFEQEFKRVSLVSGSCKQIKCKFYDICLKKEREENEVEYLNVEKINKEIEKIKYPIYYLDFESYSSMYPRFTGEIPFSCHVFMYSLIVQEIEGGPLIYKNFIAPDNQNDYRCNLFKKLCADIEEEGTVLVYNENFEKTRLKEASDLFPELAQKLLKIYNNIYDLLYLLKGHKSNKNKDYAMNNYYNTLQGGSYSIKKVLPVLVNENYNHLKIKNGIAASDCYSKFHLYKDDELDNIKKELIKYCNQDVYSMVQILGAIKKKVNKRLCE